MTISEIEKLTYEEAAKIAVEEMVIKGHNIVFANPDEGFGYSALVFKNGKHIYHANDYELHHGWMVKERGKEALRDYYIQTMNNKLFTVEELMQDVKDYDDYKRKSYFLRNYYIMRYDYVSMFVISKADQMELEEKKKQFPYANIISFCYVADPAIVKIQTEIAAHLEKSFAKRKEDLSVFREMVATELANHESCVTCSYTDALSALGMNFANLSEEKQKIVLEEMNKQIDNYYN